MIASHNIYINPQAAFYNALGFISRSRSGHEVQDLMSAFLQSGQQTQQSETLRDRKGSSNSCHATNWAHSIGPMSGKQLAGDSHSEEGLLIYTSTLFERGQEIGQVPQRTYSLLNTNPPQFKAILHFGGLTGVGIGQAKKVAGHLAAKHVCHQLGIVAERHGESTTARNS